MKTMYSVQRVSAVEQLQKGEEMKAEYGKRREKRIEEEKKNDEKKMVKGNNNSNQTNKQTEKKCSLVTKAKCRRADLSGVYTIHAELRFLALMMVVQVQKV